MSVPYGFGVGDFVAVGTLAWNVYKQGGTRELRQNKRRGPFLSRRYQKAEETVFKQDLSEDKIARLKVISNGCYAVLNDLDAVVKEYESLGTQSKRTWARMKWGTENIADLRTRMTSHSMMLSTFITTSQVRVEQKLDRFLEEWRQGKREGSVISRTTLDSLSKDDKATWRSIRKQLEDIGISVAAFDANRGYIFNWFLTEIDSGTFSEEQEGNQAHDDTPSGSKIRKTPTSPQNNQLEKDAIADLNSLDTAASIYSKDGTVGLTAFENETKPFLWLAARLRTLRLEKKLCDLVNKKDQTNLRKTLSKYASQDRHVESALTTALTLAARSAEYEMLEILFEYGASVNVPDGQRSPLVEAVDGSYTGLVDELRAKGADLNHQTQFLRPDLDMWKQGHLSALVTAMEIGDIAMTNGLLLAGADAAQKLWDRKHQYFITPLHYAASGRVSDIVLDILLKTGVDVNTPSSFGTPLAFAFVSPSFGAWHGMKLLEIGAQVGIELWDEDLRKNISPMHVAVAFQSSPSISYCLEHGFKPTPDILTWAEDFATGVGRMPRIAKLCPHVDLRIAKLPKETYHNILTLLKQYATSDKHKHLTLEPFDLQPAEPATRQISDERTSTGHLDLSSRYPFSSDHDVAYEKLFENPREVSADGLKSSKETAPKKE